MQIKEGLQISNCQPDKCFFYKKNVTTVFVATDYYFLTFLQTWALFSSTLVTSVDVWH